MEDSYQKFGALRLCHWQGDLLGQSALAAGAAPAVDDITEGTLANIRTNGQDQKAELEQHFLELANDVGRDDQSDFDIGSEFDVFDAAMREVAWLRKEVHDLRERLGAIRTQTEGVEAASAAERPWLRIATTVAVTFVLGKLVQRMRLGASGAAAVPLIAAQIGGRIR